MTADKTVLVMAHTHTHTHIYIYIYIIVTWRDVGKNSEITSNESESVPVRLSRRYAVSDDTLIAMNISMRWKLWAEVGK
jgi:hypothetical protein